MQIKDMIHQAFREIADRHPELSLDENSSNEGALAFAQAFFDQLPPNQVTEQDRKTLITLAERIREHEEKRLARGEAGPSRNVLQEAVQKIVDRLLDHSENAKKRPDSASQSPSPTSNSKGMESSERPAAIHYSDLPIDVVYLIFAKYRLRDLQNLSRVNQATRRQVAEFLKDQLALVMNALTDSSDPLILKAKAVVEAFPKTEEEPISDEAMLSLHTLMGEFFADVPTKDLLAGDLASFILKMHKWASSCNTDLRAYLALLHQLETGKIHLENLPNLQSDKQAVLLAASNDISALQYANEELKNDREIVLAAVKQNGLALQWADPSLRKDREIVLAASRQNSTALKFADPYLLNDRAFMLAAVTQNGWTFEYADPSLRKDREIVLAAVKQNGSALQYADPEFRKDREIVLAAVTQNGSALQYADSELRADFEMALTAVTQNIEAFQYLDPELQKDLIAFLAESDSISEIEPY